MGQGPREERAAEIDLQESPKEYTRPGIKLDVCRAKFWKPSLRITNPHRLGYYGSGCPEPNSDSRSTEFRGVVECPPFQVVKTTLDSKHLWLSGDQGYFRGTVPLALCLSCFLSL